MMAMEAHTPVVSLHCRGPSHDLDTKCSVRTRCTRICLGRRPYHHSWVHLTTLGHCIMSRMDYSNHFLCSFIIVWSCFSCRFGVDFLYCRSFSTFHLLAGCDNAVSVFLGTSKAMVEQLMARNSWCIITGTAMME